MLIKLVSLQVVINKVHWTSNELTKMSLLLIFLLHLEFRQPTYMNPGIMCNVRMCVCARACVRVFVTNRVHGSVRAGSCTFIYTAAVNARLHPGPSAATDSRSGLPSTLPSACLNIILFSLLNHMFCIIHFKRQRACTGKDLRRARKRSLIV